MLRKVVMSVLTVLSVLASVLVVVGPASAYSLRYTGTPGNVSFDGPVAEFGYSGSGSRNLELLVRSVGTSSAANKQYAVVHLHVYFSCSTGWCTQTSVDKATPWLYSGQTFNWDTAVRQNPNQYLIDPIVPSGRHYTYVAQTTWYNANYAVIGQETYYPTSGNSNVFTTFQKFEGNNDFACVDYAYSRGYCSLFGLANASFSPTGKLYTVYASGN